MGFFDRFKRAVKSNINDLISKAEDPEKMLNQLIIDMNTQLVESKKSIAAAIADEKKLERQMKEHLNQASEWEKRAVLAVKAGKDDLAKEALIRKQELDGLSVQYKEQWSDQHASVEKLKDALRQLQQKIEEAKRKKNILIARAKRVEAQKKIHETVNGLSDTSAFEVFDRMTEKVDRLEAEAEALSAIGDLNQTQSLEDEFKQLESGASNADLMLEELKQKMLDDKTEE